MNGLLLSIMLGAGGVPQAVADYIAAYEAKDVPAMQATLGETFIYYDYPRQPRYDDAAGFTAALQGYLAGLAEQGVTVTVRTQCQEIEARTAGSLVFHVCEHRSAYRGGGADQDERFLAIYGLKDGRIASIERLGDVAGEDK